MEIARDMKLLTAFCHSNPIGSLKKPLKIQADSCRITLELSLPGDLRGLEAGSLAALRSLLQMSFSLQVRSFAMGLVMRLEQLRFKGSPTLYVYIYIHIYANHPSSSDYGPPACVLCTHTSLDMAVCLPVAVKGSDQQIKPQTSRQP